MDYKKVREFKNKHDKAFDEILTDIYTIEDLQAVISAIFEHCNYELEYLENSESNLFGEITKTKYYRATLDVLQHCGTLKENLIDYSYWNN